MCHTQCATCQTYDSPVIVCLHSLCLQSTKLPIHTARNLLDVCMPVIVCLHSLCLQSAKLPASNSDGGPVFPLRTESMALGEEGLKGGAGRVEGVRQRRGMDRTETKTRGGQSQ